MGCAMMWPATYDQLQTVIDRQGVQNNLTRETNSLLEELLETMKEGRGNGVQQV